MSSPVIESKEIDIEQYVLDIVDSTEAALDDTHEEMWDQVKVNFSCVTHIVSSSIDLDQEDI